MLSLPPFVKEYEYLCCLRIMDRVLSFTNDVLGYHFRVWVMDIKPFVDDRWCSFGILSSSVQHYGGAPSRYFYLREAAVR
jgi:hypothetical protein